MQQHAEELQPTLLLLLLLLLLVVVVGVCQTAVQLRKLQGQITLAEAAALVWGCVGCCLLVLGSNGHLH
jgi:hypothetical protein